MAFADILTNLPEVASPTQKRLSFKEKLKWTLTILVAYYILGHVPLFGLGANALAQFEFLSIILGAKFGSLISLGIGPIVTASIVLQLLNGSGIVKFDLTTHDGKRFFQGLQKLLSIGFIIFEAIIYVMMGGLQPSVAVGSPFYTPLVWMLILQLTIGGLLIMFMDEVVSKWGFGSGLSLFIAAGVSEQIFIRTFSPLTSAANPDVAIGALPAMVQSLARGQPTEAGLLLAGVLATVIVFAMSVYAQAMKVEIPLSFGRVRGHGIRWPLSFIYTSNIPVILVAALLANIQLWARLLQNWGHPFLGTFAGNSPASGLVLWMTPTNMVRAFLTGSMTSAILWHSLAYISFMMIGCVIFSWFWVQTSGMDARSQAKQMISSGLQIPGFRRDERVLERLLERYIGPLTVMGAIAVGILAAVADIAGALSSGTGILLAVMIIFKLYEEIAQQHLMDMNPMMRKFMGKA
ncbi:preprotein translocase subunit SecY [Candidatus Woesearchaeota archaeon CG_4_10_14_0_2_um_filter_57_5]|nr:MAG: preprotein translocase subunit SecY [Candidatus Woesearchaeota archaeon CG1_02_57_44]PIZ53214.1 MAG: preprotein translocase subunit SecY [Candidatus Woesearchaeota archaeon CG_4_10_14_0_2_um_filter_57_5]